MFRTEIEIVEDLMRVYGEDVSLGKLLANLKEQDEILSE